MSLWLASFVSFLPTYGFGLTLVTGLALYSQFRKSELSRAALEREWSAARLAALRMQLSPHTLFNLLHTIRGLIEWDPKGAQSMVVQLADLLRRLLNAGERDFSRLGEELQFVRLYLELQQKRFSDRLSVILPPPQDIVDAWVPSLILQPLVENAVVHGLAGHQGPVTIRLDVARAGRLARAARHQHHRGGQARGPSGHRPQQRARTPGRAVRGPRQPRRRARASSEWVSEITLPEIHASPERRAARPAAALLPA